MPHAVIFDVDGVLVDSYAAHLQRWLMLASDHGVAFSETDFACTFGRTSRDIISAYFPGDRSDKEITAIDDRKEAIFRDIVSDDFPAMEGAVELIDALCNAGVLIAAGSSGPPENVALALNRLGRRDCFGAAVTGRDVSRGKPDPEVFLVAATRLGVEPGRCAVVEDAAPGIQAAQAAGMVAIGLVSTGRTHAELAAPDLVVDSLGELSPATIVGLIDQAG